MSSFTYRLIGIAGVAAGLSITSSGQQSSPPRVLTAGDYTRAERFMTYNTTPLVLHSGVRATRVSDDRFWYRTTTEKGPEAFLIDAAAGSRSACDLPPCKAPVREGGGGGRGAQRTDAPSPDGKRTAFIRDWNLWV